MLRKVIIQFKYNLRSILQKWIQKNSPHTTFQKQFRWQRFKGTETKRFCSRKKNSLKYNNVLPVSRTKQTMERRDCWLDHLINKGILLKMQDIQIFCEETKEVCKRKIYILILVFPVIFIISVYLFSLILI